MFDQHHKTAFDAIGFAAHVLTPQTDALSALVEAERIMHSSLHITDPTLYGRAINSQSFAQQVKLARAALAFVAAVQDVKAEIEAQSHG